MRIGLVGLPQVGKTTVFNLLTHGHADTSSWGGRAQSNIGVAQVPDPRLDRLAGILQPKKVTPATIEYVDVPGMARGEGGAAVDSQGRDRTAYLSNLSNADALAHVVRAFENPNIPHTEGTIDPLRDVGLFELEMIFSDLVISERRLERLARDLKKIKSADLEMEQELLERLKAALEEDRPLREVRMSDEERKIARGFAFLSEKPILLLLNLDDRDTAKIPEALVEYGLAGQAAGGNVRACAVCGKIESEIAALPKEDAQLFMDDLGLAAGGGSRIIEESYSLLGLRTFYTTESSELRAWPIPGNSSALHAAGMIHTDIARGFIKAEVVGYRDLVDLGSFQAARSRGILRYEGKDYRVQDGDVILFRFNI